MGDVRWISVVRLVEARRSEGFTEVVVVDGLVEVVSSKMASSLFSDTDDGEVEVVKLEDGCSLVVSFSVVVVEYVGSLLGVGGGGGGGRIPITCC